MTIDEIVQIVNASQLKPLTSLQQWLLRQAWEGKTYSSMAIEANYVEEYLRKTAAGLWTLLSDLWGEPINKTNFRPTLESRPLTIAQQQLIEDYSCDKIPPCSEFPSGPIGINSRYYIPRPPIEELAYEELAKPGSVIRIRAPKKMGKTSLLLRLIAHAESLNYRIASIDLQQADSRIFSDLDKFLRWFSTIVSRELQLEPRLEEYWDENIGSKVSCTHYFQSYVLKQIASPLVVSLNELNRIFDYPQIVQDFLPLLRYWHEQSRTTEIWQKFRLLVAYSTEIFLSMQLTQSPFNIGLPLKLPPFTLEQAQALAQRYGLDWTWTDGFRGKKLMALVGGHPYLVHLAYYHLSQQKISPKQLLQQAHTSGGIYIDHLRQLIAIVQSVPEFKVALQQMLVNETPVKLDPILTYQLESIGLVRVESDRSEISCELYRLYFKEQLFPEIMATAIVEATEDSGVQQHLATENQLLQQLAHIDEITQLANRRYFNIHLRSQWQQAISDRRQTTGEISDFSLILCSIDYFKTYNDIYGESAGDRCLRQVALAINQTLGLPFQIALISAENSQKINLDGTVLQSSSPKLAARYGGDEFGIILPNTKAENAIAMAEMIRSQVKALAIPTNNAQVGGFPANTITVSIGVTSTLPNRDRNLDLLLRTVEQALYQARREGRDRVVFIT